MARTKTQNIDPFPSSPSRPPTHNIWLKYGAGLERMQIHAWCTDWATWACLKIAINGREYGLVDKDMGWHETEDGELRFRIVEPSGSDILKDQPEHDWEPNEPHLSQLKSAAGIIHEPDTPHKASNPTREANKRKTRTRAPVSKDGLITIGEICAELGIQARDARKTLRGKVEKPDAGWAWPKDEAEKIKKMLK